MNLFQRVCLALVIVGGINWGLFGLVSLDLVSWLCGGSASIVARVIYCAVGVAALVCIPAVFKKEEPEHTSSGAPDNA